MIVLSEDSPCLAPSASAQSLKTMTEAARMAGCRVHYIPQEEACETAEDALAHVPAQDEETAAAWLGYIPSPKWYAAIYTAALEKRIRLLNTPVEHLNVQEFDRAYVRLQELTPASVIITDTSQCGDAVQHLGLPVFVKGTVQSRKARGWKACAAYSLEELQQLCGQLLALDARSRGRVVVRELVKLRYARSSELGFPFGREYRCFIHQQKVLGYGYYWEGDDPLKALSRTEEDAVLGLALEAARRIGTPFAAVDIGQTQEEQWSVIETGDAQFSGASQTPLLPQWHAISQIQLHSGHVG